MDLNSLVAMLGPEAREAVAQFYGRGRPPATDPEDGFGAHLLMAVGAGHQPGGDSDVLAGAAIQAHRRIRDL